MSTPETQNAPKDNLTAEDKVVCSCGHWAIEHDVSGECRWTSAPYISFGEVYESSCGCKKFEIKPTGGTQ